MSSHAILPPIPSYRSMNGLPLSVRSLTHVFSSLRLRLTCITAGNSRRPELTQTNLVDIYLFRGDSQQQILHERNFVNPFGSAGVYRAQVNDTWFGAAGRNWDGHNTSFPFYWVISRSDRGLDGSQVSQPIFSAVREYLLSISGFLSPFLSPHLSLSPRPCFADHLAVFDFVLLPTLPSYT